MTTASPVLLERNGAIATVTLNRPEARNAMSDAMLDLLVDYVAEVTADPDIRVIILRGSGRSFCVGGDLQAFSETETAELPSRGASIEKLHRHMRASELLRASDAVSIAAVRGASAGAGLSLALACDLRIGTDNSVYRSAFVDAALSGDFGGTWLLARLIGESRAKRMAFLNEKVDAVTALEWGLLSSVHPDESFDAAVDEAAHNLAAKAPLALRYLKQNFGDVDLGFADASAREAERHVDCSRSADLVEAAEAFLGGRQPQFNGK